MRTYTAKATREGKYWVVTVVGVGVTQARGLREAQVMAEDLVSAVKGLRKGQFAVDLRPELDVRLTRAVEAARRANERLDVQRRAASATSRATVRELVEVGGLTGRDAAVVLGVSPQRVSQLLAD